MESFRLYGNVISGNSAKVAFTADHLGLDYEWVEIDLQAGEHKSDAFLAVNPAGQLPAITFADGRTLAQSNAIIRYLASGTALLPQDAFAQAQVDEVMLWEQSSHMPYIAICRVHMLLMGKTREEREPWRVERGEAALDHMDKMLARNEWFVGENLSVADISLLAYTRLAHEGGFDLSSRPNVVSWVKRCEQALGLEAAI